MMLDWKNINNKLVISMLLSLWFCNFGTHSLGFENINSIDQTLLTASQPPILSTSIPTPIWPAQTLARQGCVTSSYNCTYSQRGISYPPYALPHPSMNTSQPSSFTLTQPQCKHLPCSQTHCVSANTPKTNSVPCRYCDWKYIFVNLLVFHVRNWSCICE